MLTGSNRVDVLFVNWRDDTHPDGGGSERYVHRMAEGLAAAGLRVGLFCAAHERAPARETVRGAHIHRRGGRFTVYAWALLHVLRQRPRLVVDVQNGVPFASPLVTRRPVINLVHHVHREQWPIVWGRWGGALGWWVESTLAPRIHRRSRYVTVSQATAEELVALGIGVEQITVVHNGVEPPPPVRAERSDRPRLVVLGRLVPHKQVEHALEVAARLRPRWPDLRLAVVGEGWWEEQLRTHAGRLGITDIVEFRGYLDEQAKHEELARAWVHLCPSVKEGWGLVVTEAAGHGVPTVGYRSAGGLRESVVDGRTGLLVEDLDGLTAAVEQLLADEPARARMGAAGARHAAAYSWPASIIRFAGVLSAAAAGSAVPVGKDVDLALLARLGDVVRVHGGLDAGDGGHAQDDASGEREDHGDEGLHSGTRFSVGRQRSVTVDVASTLHNAAPATSPSSRA